MSGFSVHRSLCSRSHSGDHSDGLTERSSSFGWSFSNRLRVVVPRRGFYRINICCRILLLLICPRRAVVSSSWGRSKKSVHKVASSSIFPNFLFPIGATTTTTMMMVVVAWWNTCWENPDPEENRQRHRSNVLNARCLFSLRLLDGRWPVL